MLPGPWELILIIFVILLLFGAAKLPDLARSVGRSARIFKSEMKEMQNDPAHPDSAATDSAANPKPREIEAGNSANQATKSADQGFWDEQDPQPRNTN